MWPRLHKLSQGESDTLQDSDVLVVAIGEHILLGAHKIIGVTKQVTLAFFCGIFITTNRKS
jgi:hypothetical protein